MKTNLDLISDVQSDDTNAASAYLHEAVQISYKFAIDQEFLDDDLPDEVKKLILDCARAENDGEVGEMACAVLGLRREVRQAREIEPKLNSLFDELAVPINSARNAAPAMMREAMARVIGLRPDALTL